MRLQLHGKGLELTPALRSYAEQRLGKLDRYFPGEEVSGQVVMSVQRERQIVEATIPLAGWLLRAQEADTSMYAAIDLVLAKLERQIHKYKTRLSRKPRHEAAREAEGRPEPPEGTLEDVVRRKTFKFPPMTLEEAMVQIDLLDHGFFVFRDAEGGGVQVLYRRRGGGYGLIAEE